MMNPLDKQFLELLSSALNGEQINPIQNWPDMLEELKKQTVLCLPYEAIKKSKCLSPSEMAAYQMMCYQQMAANMRLLHEQQQMVDLFEEHAIPFVILKGASAAMYYPHPEFRTMGDIDMIVKPEDFDKAYQLLEQHYKCVQPLKENSRHAGFATQSGIEIELHRFFSLGARNEKTELLDQLIYSGIDRREWHTIDNCRFPSLPAIENGLVLLDHVHQHLNESYMGYRQVIDFREFIVAEKDIINVFLDMAKNIGLHKLAEALLLIYQKYLGVCNETKAFQVNDGILDMMLTDFIHSGNFGRKEGPSGTKRAASIISATKNPLDLIILLQKNGRIHWKATNKYVFLRPFAWIYQIGYYIYQLRKNGGISIIIKGQKRISDKEKLLNELGLL